MTAKRRPEQIEAVKQVIEQEITCAQALLQTLERERNALLGSHLEELEQACADKLAAANHLQSLGVSLAQWDAAPGQIEQLLSQTSDPGSTLARWRELLQLAAQCQQQNLANGALLDERQAQLRWTRRALHGAAAAPTYGRSGNHGYGPGPRSLASA